MSPVERRPEISVVIPTHDRPASLLRLLRALRDGSFPAERFEVVVVADGCSDNTVAVAQGEPLPFPVRVLDQSPGRGAAAARNLGAAHAGGSLLVFLDDDIEPGPALLAEHQRAHAEAGGPAVAIGPPLPVRPARASLDTIAAWVWWEDQFSRMRQPGHRFSYAEVFGGIVSLPAALFESVGGFDVQFLCREDGELGLRLIYAGARVLFAPAGGGWHHELRDHPRLILRKRAEGVADVRLARLHPELWPVLRISWPPLPWWDPLGLLRRSALSAPPVAGLLIGALTALLPMLERLRFRGTWRKVQAGVMYGWYWRGIADAVGGPRGLGALAAECGTPAPESAAPLTVDLADGMVEAERQVDASCPAAVRVCFGELEIGMISPRAGAEPLRGSHLRAALGTELPHELIATLSTVAAAGHPRAPRLGALRPDAAAGRIALPSVSVIIPAHNAADTLAETLGSLLRQTHPAWEAIVVDDGSTDATAAIAARYADREPRIRLVRQPQQGPGPARNTGLALAGHPWLLFLDADDWLLPQALERLSAMAAASGTVDAVHGSWARIASDGTIEDTKFAPPEANLFPYFAEFCAFPIHVCLFRRELVARVGGFDPALRTCEDWDFWQRVARSGARFARLPEKVAHYRMQPRSGATAVDHLLPDGLTVIQRGHGPDPRVQNSKNVNGAPRANLPAARLRFSTWAAGLLIGRGRPPDRLLEALQGDSASGLSPGDVAANLFRTVPLSLAHGVRAWDEVWPQVVGELTSFLDGLERQSGSWRLARRSMLALEQLTLDVSRGARPFQRGSTLAAAVEVTRTIEPIAAPAGVERVHCDVLVEGMRIGAVLLPVCDGAVAARVLADAIAATFAWPILGRFFAATRYVELQLVRAPTGVVVQLDGLPLAPPTPDDVVIVPDRLHELIGWTLFLQEVWGVPGLPAKELYREGGSVDQDTRESEIARWPAIEISAALPRWRTPAASAFVEVRVGGVPIGTLPVQSDGGVITPSRLRSVITTEAGFELCRAVVREAILGQPFQDGRIRPRLAAAAERLRAGPAARIECDVIPRSATGRLAPGWREVAGTTVEPGVPTLLLARHTPDRIHSAADRRASLPVELLSELLETAAVVGPPALRLAGSEERPGRVEYLPDLLWRPDQETALARLEPVPGTSPPTAGREYDRHHFESLFASGSDPWSYETPYELLKYQQTLSLLPPGRIGKALELACAEGRFTRMLAPRVEQLIAADFSQIALQRAAAVCPAPNVRFQLLDLSTDELPGGCDLIVCSEVLYYLGGVEALKAIGGKLASALATDGHLLLAHANLQADDPDRPGFDWDLPYGARRIGETLASVPGLRLVRELRTDAYRIHLFQRRDTPQEPEAGRPSVVVEHATHRAPSPHVAARFQNAGRRSAPTDRVRASRSTMPILMYHSIADTGPAGTERYRVRPEMFAAQLRYLDDAGFSTVTIHQWLTAVRLRRPFPRRSVLLTFDDGYCDFAEIAWPLLQRHGFGALVFLVADSVGGTNQWDAALGAPVPLMDWDQVGRLAAAGVEFGSHSASHRPMTGLSPADIAREAIRSRRVLERGLGRAVTTFAYPHGDTDPVVQHLVGACGFEAGFTCREARAGFLDQPLALPRIEISGVDDLAAFITTLGG